ncbi:FABP family protein [Ralstonia solanacearum]|uniref:heme-binding beta-barrel domain-containing protein n=1 Tax=Ralstonia solanacearum TaxID=305 RepID=UPI001FFBBE14
MKKILVAAMAMSCLGIAHAKNDAAAMNPLAKLIGVWEGDKGIDVAPAQKKTGLPPGSAASSPYFERIVITDGPGATNASEQDLVSVSYHQQVFRKSDNKLFHDQVGYWIWDKNNNVIIDSFCIPRGVCATAEGRLKHQNDFNVSTSGPFAENSFMQKNGKTHEFSIDLSLNQDGTLTYSQRTSLTIYGKKFVHVDSSTLRKKSEM